MSFAAMMPGHAGGLTPIALTISASSNTPYNIFTAAGSPAYPAAVTLTINSGVNQGSNSTASAAIDTGTGWSANSTISIVNNGQIAGMGGAGGAGAGMSNSSTVSPPATNGSIGGHAINMQFPITIANNGLIGGGGGGGGGGGTGYIPGGTERGVLGSGGGGAGGAGGAVGGGSSTMANGAFRVGTQTAASAGTFTGAGAGANSANWWDSSALSIGPCNSVGGAGGALGQSGGNGSCATDAVNGGLTSANGSGGAPGYAIKRNGNLLTGQADGTYNTANWAGQVGT